MKTVHLIAAAAFVSLASPSAFAAPPQAAAPMAMPVTPADHSAHHGAQMHAMVAAAQNARTPAERNRLMAENMVMMKDHMAQMTAMMEPMPMPMATPMVMDAAHMEKMARHMAMMHQMMESLMVQQQLMMKPGR
jgi:hypothetical protein